MKYTTQKQLRSELQFQYNTTDLTCVIDICKTIPYSELTSSTPFAIKDKQWLNANPNPTAYDYYKQKCIEQETVLSDIEQTKTNCIFPPEKLWIPLSELFLSDGGDQRIQFKERKTARVVYDRADDLDCSRANVRLGRIDIPGHNLEGKYGIIDGGGTCCAFVLRDMDKVPVNSIVSITTPEQLGDYFFHDAESKQSVAGEETFKHKVVTGDPEACLKHRVYQDTGTTAIRNHPNKDLKHFALTALSKLLKERFHNSTTTSISGDTVNEIKDESLYPTRKFRNIIESLEAIQSNYDESPISPAVGKELTRFYATFQSIMNLRQLTQFIKDYKEGVCKIKGANVHPMCLPGQVDFSSQTKISDSLDLQSQTDSHRSYGTVVFGKLWNHRAKGNPGLRKISPEFLDLIFEQGRDKAFLYDATKNYKDTIKSVADQI